MDYVVYNNLDTVGELYKKVSLSVFTNKNVSEDAVGGTVWLIVGGGKPRNFRLRSWFIVSHVESGEEHGFRTRLSGSEGSIFDPMLEIVQEEWFLKLKKDQGNFAFGFNPIKDQEAVSQLQTW